MFGIVECERRGIEVALYCGIFGVRDQWSERD